MSETSAQAEIEQLRTNAKVAAAHVHKLMMVDIPKVAEMERENTRLRARNAALREALKALDAVIDFSEPMSENKPWIFEEYSDLNAAFDKARAALAAGETPEKE